MLRKILIILFVLAIPVFNFCSEPSKYEQAKAVIKEAKLKYGNDFFRKKEFEDAFAMLESIPSTSTDYKKAQEFIERLRQERLDLRRMNVKKMMETAKKQKKLLKEMKEKNQEANPDTK